MVERVTSELRIQGRTYLLTEDRRMLEFLGRLDAHIVELNDCPFVIVGQETPRIEAL